jgi:leader peptidase (prepilin peptidase)/N-methyltransferase
MIDTAELSSIATGLCALGGLLTLIALVSVDLRQWVLPNIYILIFAILGVGFHASLGFAWLSALHMVYGMLVGGGTLFMIRYFGNWYYGVESLGLGDVKLFLAAGLWLGVEAIINALIIGAIAGLFHGAIFALQNNLRTGRSSSLRHMRIPAGPGFIIGIIAAGFIQFHGQF